MTFQPNFRVGPSHWVWSILLIPVLHCIWLLKIHNSEEEDKVLWTKYRNEACALAGLQKEPDYRKRKVSSASGLTWLVTEAGITFLLALVFLWRVIGAP